MADRKTKMGTRPLISWDIFYFCSETAERNWTKLVSEHDINVLCQVCIFGVYQKTKIAAQPLIGWDIFDFFSETAERNSAKPKRKQDRNIPF